MLSAWNVFVQSHKGSGKTMSELGAMYRQQTGKPKTAAKRPSNCAGRAQAECTPPCKYATGAKRQYCHTGTKAPARAGSKSPGSKPGVKRGPRDKLSAPFHACAGLPEQNCLQPACMWQGGKNQRCVTGSGASRQNALQGPERKALLASLRRQQQQQQQQQGGWW